MFLGSVGWTEGADVVFKLQGWLFTIISFFCCQCFSSSLSAKRIPQNSRWKTKVSTITDNVMLRLMHWTGNQWNLWQLQYPIDYFLTAWADYSPVWCSKSTTEFLSVNVKSSKDCVDKCLEKNPTCKAVEWWANGQQECFECFKPSLRAEYTETDDESYPPHVLVRPNKATPTRPSGKLTFPIRDSKKLYNPAL